jgi:outer membrane receptor protein involved in Fe transport
LVDGPTGGVIRALGGSIASEDPFGYRVPLNTDPMNSNDLYGVSAHFRYDASAFNFESITAFRSADTFTSADVDVTNVDIIEPNPNGFAIETFTQEFRLSSTDDDAAFSWFVGGFYFHEEISNTDGLIWGSAARPYVNALLGAGGASLPLLETITGSASGSFFGAGQGISERSTQENDAFSIFGMTDFELTDRLTATLGVNFTYDEKTITHQISTTDAYSQVDLAPLTPVVGPAAVSALQAIQIFPQFLAIPNAVENGVSEDDKITYSARLNYEVIDDLNIFVSYATGYKATSWNLSRDSRPILSDFPAIAAAGLLTTNLNSGTRFADPETATVFEVGVRGRINGVRFSATYFDQKIEDFQTFVFLGAGFGLSNAEQRSATGFEFDIDGRVTPNLRLWAAGTFLDPVYDSYVASSFGDLSGQTPAQTPETSFNVGGTYSFAIGDVGFDLQADYLFQSNSLFEDDPALQAAVGSRYSNEQNLVNVSLGAELPGAWTVRAWGRNVFNDEYLNSFAFPTPLQSGSYSGLVGMPRTYGITVGKSF